MWFRRAAVVLLIPLLALGYVYCFQPQVVRGWSLYTAEANAARIQPGMTLAEVERIIGGPPGSYVFSFPSITRSQNTFSSVNKRAVPNVLVWQTHQGRIEVRDGDYWPRDITAIPGIEPDGLVDSASWKPYAPSTAERDARNLIFAGVVAALLFSVYLVLRRSRTSTPPVAPGTP
ncbi:MAG: hypothetical protein U0792_09130 [Gemmataceae bacterium]